MLDVQMIGRFVQQKDLRPLRQRPSDVNALPLATGQGVPGAFLQVQHVHILQRLTNDCIVLYTPRLECRQPGRAAQFDGVQYGHGVAGFSLLLDHRQQARHVPAAQGLKCLPAQADRAADRLLNTGQQLEQGGFTRAVGTHHGQGFTRGNAQVDIAQQRRATNRITQTGATEHRCTERMR